MRAGDVNPGQQLWWKQAQADLELFMDLSGPRGWRYQCHALQALQMATEKISKAAFRADDNARKKLSHLGLTKLLRRFGSVSTHHQSLVATIFSIRQFDRFADRLRRFRAIARDIERLPSAVSGPDQPNTEYPWPHDRPQHALADWKFAVFERLNTSDGRAFLRFVERAIDAFPQYAHIFR